MTLALKNIPADLKALTTLFRTLKFILGVYLNSLLNFTSFFPLKFPLKSILISFLI